MPPFVKPNTDVLPGIGGGVGEGPGDLGAEEGAEKASIVKVKDLLQQAMDMLTELDTKAEPPGLGPGPAPPSERRPPMSPRPGPMGMM